LEAAGAEPGHIAQPRIVLTPTRIDHVKQRFRGFLDSGAPVLALLPFSVWRNKRWPVERYRRVGERFIAKGWHVAILGSPDEKAEAEQLQKRLGPASLSCAGRLPLVESACVVSMCSLAVGNDTGLAHLARALSVKTGVVYGSTTRHFGFFPSGKPAFRVFESRRLCRPCHAHGGNLCVRLSRPCLADVGVDAVVEGLEELAGSTGK
jgi:heptosyltransferase-2